MLPQDPDYRKRMVLKTLEAGSSIHGVIENITIKDEQSWYTTDDLFRLDAITRHKKYTLEMSND